MATKHGPAMTADGEISWPRYLLYPVITYLALTAGLWSLVYQVVVPRLPAGYLTELMIGPFQYFCTLAFLLGVVMVVDEMRDCYFVEGFRAREAEQLAESLHQTWTWKTGGNPTSPPDQGQQILAEMKRRGLTAGDDAASRVTRRSLYLHRLHRLGLYLHNTRARNISDMMDVNRDLSDLDSDALSARFTVLRYLAYLIPVIGFLGTVYGISLAMNGIGEALPQIKELDGFMKSLQKATKALRVSFDTTLLALVYSGLLTLFLSLATRGHEKFLSVLDTWVIDNIFSHIRAVGGQDEAMGRVAAKIEDMTQATLSRLGKLEKALTDVLNSLNVSSQGSAASTKQIAAWVKEGNDRSQRAGDVLSALGRTQQEMMVSTKEFGASMARVAGACEAIRDAQATGREEVRSLAAAVRGLPGLAKSLGDASGKLEKASSGIASLGDLGPQLANLGHLVGKIEAVASSLDSIAGHTASLHRIRDSLAHEVATADGTKRIDAILAIQEMSESLRAIDKAFAKQVSRITDINKSQLDSAMKNVAEANTLLANGMGGLTHSMNGLNSAFLTLSHDIRMMANRAAGLMTDVDGAYAEDDGRDD